LRSELWRLALVLLSVTPSGLVSLLSVLPLILPLLAAGAQPGAQKKWS
jgi:hypothetical protein